MRHKPATGAFATRNSTKESYLGKYFIPKGASVGVHVYGIHHLDEFWPDPYKFDPLRFTPENSAGRHSFAYLPFSLGRRTWYEKLRILKRNEETEISGAVRIAYLLVISIGTQFSLLEQKVFLSMALQRFTFEKGTKCTGEALPLWRVYWPRQVVLNAIPRNTQYQV